MRQTTGVGAYATGERHIVFDSRTRLRGATRAIYYHHGAGQSANSSLLGIELTDRVKHIVDEVAPVVMPDLSATPGGTFSWGNDQVVAKFATARTWAVSQFGYVDDKVLLWGTSMGSLSILNWAKDHLDEVAAILLQVPAVGLQRIHDADINGYAATIETAYGGLAAWNAAKVAHDPSQHGAVYGDIPILIYAGLNDTIAEPTPITTFAAAAGPNTDVVWVNDDHAAIDSIPVMPLAGFLKEHL